MYIIEVKDFFSASHQLPDTDSLVTKACTRLHGHTYCVIVTAYSNKLNSGGMITDFKAIKNIIQELDHQHLNDFIKVPTAENTAKWIHNHILVDLGLESKIKIAEGYKGENTSWVYYEN